jgi:hypothetical protein
MWQQSSRIECLSVCVGERTLIKALTQSTGNLMEDVVEMQHMTSKFYKTLYTSKGVQNMNQVLDHVPPKVNVEIGAMLIASYDPS